MHRVLFLVVGAAAVFVWLSSGALPERVASHFMAEGAANGYMPRMQYVTSMAALVVVVPLLLVSMAKLASYLPTQFVNLPNRQFWLSPERRAIALASFSRFGVWLACGIVAFLCLVHWFVVQANLLNPPRLEQAPLVTAAALLLIALFCSILVTLRTFLRVP